LNSQAKFTAAQLANAGGVSRQAVEKSLRNVPASGLTEGGIAKAWSIGALPCYMRERLAKLATQNNCRTVEDYISGAVPPWSPPIPIRQIEQRFIDAAFRLQTALLPSLGRLNDKSVADAEFTRMGRDDYRREFGHEISADHWRHLLNRTVKRAPHGQWAQVEIFLADAAFRTRVRPERAILFLHRELEDALQQFGDGSKLAPADDPKASLMHRAFVHFEQLIESSPTNKGEIKRSLIEFLRAAAPSLSRGGDGAWRRWFDDWYKCWRENGASVDALRDGRPAASGRKRPEGIEKESEKIGLLSPVYEGNEARAARVLRSRGELPLMEKHYSYDPRRNKSYLPRSIRAEATNIAIQAEPLVKGPRAEEKALPHVQRDWSCLNPGDQFEADDLTINLAWKDVLENGEIKIVRGECLVFIDRRSRMILDFVLTPGDYNGALIRWGLKKLLQDKWGCPRQALIFENSIWKSRIIIGEKRATATPWRITEDRLGTFSQDTRFAIQEARIGGLNEAGVQVRHAKPRNPETKIIEGIFNVVQNQMAIGPGFVGRNERLAGYDRALKQIADARNGKEAALDGLFSHGEMLRFLEVIFDEYNNEPQNGEMLRDENGKGMTPAEMWSAYIETHPLRKLPAEAAFLLATDMTVVRRRRDGSIQISIGGKKRVFWSKETDLLALKRDYLAFWHLEEPHLITVTDMNLKNPVLVKQRVLPADGATPEQFEEINRERKAIRESRRARFSNMRAPIINTISRDSDVSDQVRDAGAIINAQLAEEKAGEQVAARAQRRVERKIRSLGIEPLPTRIEGAEDALSLMEEAQREIAAMKGANA
jgi:hypothetical protein